ncbi:MAG: hypothetical protein ACI841_004286 [Planctomycetota bacterium]|jgi:hypothetical protein
MRAMQVENTGSTQRFVPELCEAQALHEACRVACRASCSNAVLGEFSPAQLAFERWQATIGCSRPIRNTASVTVLRLRQPR